MRRHPLVLSLTLAGLLFGCSGSPDRTPDQPASAPAPASDTCGTAAATVKQHLNRSEVEKVVVVGQCTALVISTTLDDGAVETAKLLCEKAGEVAYTGDINSVAVKSKSGRELAQGITGMKCLA